jgi:hypothetical protein
VSSEHDPLDLDGNQQRREAQQAKSRHETEQEAADVVWLMGGVRGRRIINRLLEIAGYPTGNPFSPNAAIMGFNLGLQEIPKRFMVLIDAHCPDLYVQLRREAHDRSSSDRGRKRN